MRKSSKLKVVVINTFENTINNVEITNVSYNESTTIRQIIDSLDKNPDIGEMRYYSKRINNKIDAIVRATIYNSKKNINWKYDIENMRVNEFIKYYDNDLIVDVELGVGGGEEFWFILNILLNYIIPFIKLIFDVFKIFYVSKSKAIEIIENETNKDYEYICDVITHCDSWPFGFISNNRFKYKWKTEKKIMRLLHYKKNNKRWIKY